MNPNTILKRREPLSAVLALALIILFPAICLAADPTQDLDIDIGQSVGICHRQPEMTQKELKQAIDVMRDIVKQKGRLGAEEEENLIAAKGLTSDRMNCLMSKLMAANDIFGWGDYTYYKVPLTESELKFARKYAKDSQMLKRYMEDTLNIRVE